MDYIDKEGMPTVPNLKFLEKVDINGAEQHMLYKFLKRNSRKLFMPELGFGTYIYEHHSKFVCNRYGVVKYFYSP